MVKPGYKQTEIGIIPEDWKIVQLKDVSVGKFTYGVNAPAVEYMPPLPNYIRITDISDEGHFIRENRASVICTNPEQFTLRENDIVFARTGASTGKTYLYRQEDGKLVYAGFLIKASIDPLLADSRYVFAALHTKDYWNWVATSSMRSGQPGINGNEYASYQIALPDLSEQAYIADALEDTENLISSLEKKITKKKAIKQGAMQELLTGKKRLPGFTGTWKEVKLADISLKITDGSHESPPESDVGYYMPSVKDMTDIGFDYSGCKKISFSDFKKLERNGCRPNVGDVLIAKDGSILKYAFVQEKTEDIVILSSIAIVKPHPSYVDSYFLAQYFRQNQFVDKVITNYKSGTGVPRIVLKGFKQITLCIPDSVTEQAEIAEILVDMDKEIYELEQKLAKYRQVKQGMMQQLLTGNIRIL